MKKILFILLFIAPVLQAQVVFDTCVVTGRLYNQNGETEDSIKVEIVRTVARGVTRPIIIQTKKTFYTDSAGNVTMTLLRNSDVTFKTNAYGLDGKTLTIPDAATATLASLVPTATVPALYAVAVPTIQFRDSTGARTVSPDTLWVGDGLLMVNKGGGSNDYSLISTASGGTAPYGDSIRVADSLARLARDSARLANQRADVLEAEIDTVQDAAVAQLEADMAGKQDALTAPQLARLDSILAAGPLVVITSEGLIRKISIDTTGFFAKYGGVMTESDPTATAKASAVWDSAATNGDRSIFVKGRVWVQADSITFDGEAGDVIDLSLGNNWTGTLAQNDTLSFTNIPTSANSQIIQIMVTNAGTHTLVLSGVAWSGGTAPTLTAVANKRTIFSILALGGMLHGVSVLNY